jgi:flagellar biosynthesis/type III secretory pathway protein FliH
MSPVEVVDNMCKQMAKLEVENKELKAKLQIAKDTPPAFVIAENYLDNQTLMFNGYRKTRQGDVPRYTAAHLDARVLHSCKSTPLPLQSNLCPEIPTPIAKGWTFNYLHKMHDNAYEDIIIKYLDRSSKEVLSTSMTILKARPAQDQPYHLEPQLSDLKFYQKKESYNGVTKNTQSDLCSEITESIYAIRARGEMLELNKKHLKPYHVLRADEFNTQTYPNAVHGGQVIFRLTHKETAITSKGWGFDDPQACFDMAMAGLTRKLIEHAKERARVLKVRKQEWDKAFVTALQKMGFNEHVYEGKSAAFKLDVLKGMWQSPLSNATVKAELDTSFKAGVAVGRQETQANLERLVKEKNDAFLEGKSVGYNDGKIVGKAEGVSFTDYERIHREGFNMGFKNGGSASRVHVTQAREAGKKQGYTEGFAVGKEVGYNNGRSVGLALGKTEGYKEGHGDGTRLGYNSCMKASRDGWSKLTNRLNKAGHIPAAVTLTNNPNIVDDIVDRVVAMVERGANTQEVNISDLLSKEKELEELKGKVAGWSASINEIMTAKKDRINKAIDKAVGISPGNNGFIDF